MFVLKEFSIPVVAHILARICATKRRQTKSFGARNIGTISRDIPTNYNQFYELISLTVSGLATLYSDRSDLKYI